MSSKVTKLPLTPLSLLRQIRDVMALDASAQDRLDNVVRVVAEGFASEVCSVYLLRAGGVLELFASKGLKETSVHLTRLNVEQGLVGLVASTGQPLNLANAQEHPKFVYRPETGEENYHSFVAAPIFQGGKVIGVLVVQGKEAREYSLDQVEVLQALAMVLSELAISGKLVNLQEIQAAIDGITLQQISGVQLCGGVVKSVAVLHHPMLVITQYVATDTVFEKERFSDSLRGLQESFYNYIQSSNLQDDDAQREIIEIYLLFMQDRGWLARINEAITSGLTAEAAIKKVQEELHAKMSQLASPYIKERIHDLEDLSNYLLQTLLGKSLHSDQNNLPEEFILVARTLGPAELLRYDHTRLKGLIIEESSTSSHTAVIARAMDIPSLAKAHGATSLIKAGDMVILDADGGNIYVRPSDETIAEMDKSITHHAARAAEYEALRDVAAITKDGVRISLNVNAGLFVNTASILQEGVDGIGLYRTEIPYMTSQNFPDAETQAQLYEGMYGQLPDKRIIFRSFDIGGDKKVPYLNAGEEENPAMGWRATRIGLDRPSILRTQFQAFLTAAAEKQLYVMFPFIAQVSEFDAVKKLLMHEMCLFEMAGKKLPSQLKIGVMIEIPSILWQLDALMKRVDFVSIGSNDLMQFLFACDRGASHMAGRYDGLSPVMLNIVRDIARKAKANNVEVSFCGEMARKPLDSLALIGAGVRSLSVPAAAIGPLKAMVRSTSIGDLTTYIDYLTTLSEPNTREWLSAYALDHGIVV
jgi:phosphotransferase system enzyme I (PtsP)